MPGTESIEQMNIRQYVANIGGKSLYASCINKDIRAVETDRQSK
jgi:hypothetical protein